MREPECWGHVPSRSGVAVHRFVGQLSLPSDYLFAGGGGGEGLRGLEPPLL